MGTSLLQKYKSILKEIKKQENDELFEEIKTLCESEARPLHIAVVGEYSSGKSTFINALLQQEILPEGVLPTTGVATYIQQGQPSLLVSLHNGIKSAYEESMLHELSTRKDLEATGNQWLKDVEQIDLFIQNELLKDICLQ